MFARIRYKDKISLRSACYLPRADVDRFSLTTIVVDFYNWNMNISVI